MSDWKHVTLGEVVTEEQAEHICKMLNADLDPVDRVRQLTAYLNTFRAELEQKGLLPEFLHSNYNVPFYFGGTSLLIIVVVTMDFMAQVQAYIMTHQYESLLKKANFKGAGLPTR